MNKKDKQLQKHLVDEMMKVYETNPNVMIYMQSLMENYEKLEQENKQLKEDKKKARDFIEEWCSINSTTGKCVCYLDKNRCTELYKILGDKENE